ncbi:hypothetical protein HF086_002688 [Spodoptera exigua]|uniref:Uncharacterized protein n=1 Tax=Spodoptera exigua TaxID=7107 RepID=A0A922MZV0_SPOEX|nr:hypothetical protein HF086_002688 [Spodoptera exigua]
MAWGGERGVVVVDMSRRALVCAHAPAALYLAPAPPPRQPERQRSPSLDQIFFTLGLSYSPIAYILNRIFVTCRAHRLSACARPGVGSYLAVCSPTVSDVAQLCRVGHGTALPTHGSLARARPYFTFMFVPIRCKLEDSAARASPGASPHDEPDEPAAPPDPATDAAPDDKPKLDTRRKSTTWKNFNLKRQLSKVDLKFKAAFAAPSENNAEEMNAEKSNSQFYCEAPDRAPDRAPERGPEPGAGESPPGDMYERMHRELQERWSEQEGPAGPGLAPGLAPGGAARPDCLALGPRRLLGVPRRERPAGSLGGLMRRFSKYGSIIHASPTPGPRSPLLALVVPRCTRVVASSDWNGQAAHVYISFIPKEKDSSDEDSNCLKYLFADFLGN